MKLIGKSRIVCHMIFDVLVTLSQWAYKVLKNDIITPQLSYLLYSRIDINFVLYHFLKIISKEYRKKISRFLFI